MPAPFAGGTRWAPDGTPMRTEPEPIAVLTDAPSLRKIASAFSARYPAA